MKCDFCESYGPCIAGCECAKCVDPNGYQEWKETKPEEYNDWLAKKHAEDDY